MCIFNLTQRQTSKVTTNTSKKRCVGEKRKLTIPSDLGYGDHGSGSTIPGKATLVFDVELVEIKSKADSGSDFPSGMGMGDEYGEGLGDLAGLDDEMGMGDFGTHAGDSEPEEL